jgi:hypothetical protein
MAWQATIQELGVRQRAIHKRQRTEDCRNRERDPEGRRVAPRCEGKRELAEQGKNAECRQIDAPPHQVLVPPELTRRWLVQLRKDHPLLLVLHQTNNALEGESCMNHVPRRVVAGWWADPSLREDNATAAQSKAPCQDTRSQRDARPTCGVPQQLDDRPPTGEEPAHESKIS